MNELVSKSPIISPSFVASSACLQHIYQVARKKAYCYFQAKIKYLMYYGKATLDLIQNVNHKNFLKYYFYIFQRKLNSI